MRSTDIDYVVTRGKYESMWWNDHLISAGSHDSAGVLPASTCKFM